MVLNADAMSFLLTACVGCLQALLKRWLRTSTQTDHAFIVARTKAILELILFDLDISEITEESGAVEDDFIEELEILAEDMHCLGYGGALGVEDRFSLCVMKYSPGCLILDTSKLDWVQCHDIVHPLRSTHDDATP